MRLSHSHLLPRDHTAEAILLCRYLQGDCIIIFNSTDSLDFCIWNEFCFLPFLKTNSRPKSEDKVGSSFASFHLCINVVILPVLPRVYLPLVLNICGACFILVKIEILVPIISAWYPRTCLQLPITNGSFPLTHKISSVEWRRLWKPWMSHAEDDRN